MFRFLHAADLHLGAPFKGVRETANGEDATASDVVNQSLERATFRAFERLIDLAVQEKVAFIVFAGDVYNQTDKNLKARLCFRDGIRRLHEADIRSFVIHGNHDPLGPDSRRLPDSCHTFPAKASQPEIVEIDGKAVASVYGVSFGKAAVTANLARRYPKRTAAERDLFRLALLHGNVGGKEGHDNYAPCSLEDLAARDFDYWALGHVHTREVLGSGEPLAVYAGALQGLSPRETGPHGCVLLEVEGGNLVGQPRFHDLDVIRWSQEKLDIGELSSEEDLEDALTALFQTISERATKDNKHRLVRVELTGRGPIHEKLDASQQSELEEVLRERFGRETPFCWLESLQVNTQPELDLRALRDSPDCAGALLRCADELLAAPQGLETVRAELAELFSAPSGRVGGRKLPALADDDLRELLSQAAVAAVDLLHREARG